MMPTSTFTQTAEQALRLEQSGHPDQAHPLWLKLHRMQPRHVEVLASLGRVLLQMDRAVEAIPHLQQALALQPKHLNALMNMGVAKQAAGQLYEALACYEQLLPLDARFARIAQFNMGAVQQQLLDLNAARASYSKLLMLEPTHLGAHACLMFTLHYQWPVPHAHITQRAHQFGQALAASTVAYTHWPGAAHGARALRVGLLSADLFDHPVGYFLEGFLHTQAARQFEWVAYASQRQDTALTERIRPCFSQWHAVRGVPDEALARQIHQDEVDVLVDLSGFTTGHRQGTLAYRPAPVQISWLGYFGTTGMPMRWWPTLIAYPTKKPNGSPSPC
jgi:protein O-GlcNAc transferase